MSHPRRPWTASNFPQQERMLDVVRLGLQTASRIDIAVSFLRHSGLGLLMDAIRDFVERGGQFQVLTSTYLNFSQPEAIKTLRDVIGCPQIRVFDAERLGFHMKAFVFEGADIAECWVGSSNLTKGGLATNYELNLCHRDREAILAVHREFELVWNHPASVVPKDAFLADYTERYRLAALSRASHPPTVDVDGPRAGDDDRQTTIAAPAHQEIRPNEAQVAALARLSELRNLGERRAVVIAAPGIGKTYLSAFDVRASGATRVLFVSHRLEHLRQAKRSFERVLPWAKTGLLDGGNSDLDSDMLFATIQSISRNDNLLNRAWNYVVVDEFHHAHAPTYRALLERGNASFVLGLTATPERHDGHNVLALCDHNVAYEVRLHEAIRRKWLLPFHYFAIADALVDYARIPWRNGRFDPDLLENALSIRTRSDAAIRHALERGFDGTRRATVVFCAGRRHAAYMAEVLRQHDFAAVDVTGETPIADRERIYEDFSNPAHPLEWICVADVLNEGVDIPAINSILFLRPTDSSSVFIQQLGRGLRLCADCKVLTVVDFVGHHRNAWLSFDALNDPIAINGPSSVHGLVRQITPPPDCEIVLDERTQEILNKIASVPSTTKARCRELYLQMREELGRAPYPIDFVGRHSALQPSDFRKAFNDWVGCRIAMGDAEDWERELEEGSVLRVLLYKCESDWQAQRVHAYALLWGAIAAPDVPERGYAEFFQRFPRWKVEKADDGIEGASKSLQRKLGNLWQNDRLVDSVMQEIKRERLLWEVEARMLYQLDRDYRSRHGGTLKRPSDLDLWVRYSRQEMVNHFGRQFDPARHNSGVLTFKGTEFADHIIVITKLDTSGAQTQFQYRNHFESPHVFRWQSQNRNNSNSEPGARLVTPNVAKIHLFVQEHSHVNAVYCGLIRPLRHERSEPMDVWFRLESPLPGFVCSNFGVEEQEIPV